MVTHSPNLELQAHLAEYDILYREHDLHLKMRQDLTVYTLGATVGLVGAILANSSLFISPDFLRFFLILPFASTLLTWWYIRTNYSAALIDMYLMTYLHPRVSELAGAQVVSWPNFLWESELSREGRLMVTLQTIARYSLVQGPAFVSLLLFCSDTNWNWSSWIAVDWMLLALNLVGFAISGILMILTARLTSRIKRVALRERLFSGV